MRRYSLFDQVLIGFDKILKGLNPSNTTDTTDPDISDPSPSLTKTERKQSLSLMRINHSGEVCAQALYLGQGLMARDEILANQLFQAAAEEQDHLHWCGKRIEALGGKRSLLNPVFALGSFGIGILAGLTGDAKSLGFLAETEQQVTRHLDKHLQKISPKDGKSREILLQMKADEEKHATHALASGGLPLPKAVCLVMACASKIMTMSTRFI